MASLLLFGTLHGVIGRYHGLQGRRGLVSTLRYVASRVRTRVRFYEVDFVVYGGGEQVAASLTRFYRLYRGYGL